MRRYLAPLLVSLTAACATVSGHSTAPASADVLGPPTSADHERVTRARAWAEARLETQAEQLWMSWTTGRPTEPAIGKRLDDASAARETILSVRRVRASSREPDEKRALGFLEAHLVGDYLSREVAEIDDRAAAIEASEAFVALGVKHPFRELGQLLAAEGDYEKRGRLAQGALEVVRRLDQVLAERDAKMVEVARRLGYPGVEALGALVAQIDPDALASLANQFLDATEPVFRQAFAVAVRRELGLPLEKLRRADLPRLFRGVTFDMRFPREGARAALESTLAELGIGLETLPNLRIDDGSRPNKVPRPACFPVHAPDDVRLSIPAPAPADDWRPLFREVGCAEHAAHVSTKRFEFRQLGHLSSADAFAQVIEGLAETPGWLRRYTRSTGVEIEANLSGAALEQLFLARRAAARLLFDRERFAGLPKGKTLEVAYREVMERAFLFPIDPAGGARWLAGRDAIYGSAAAFSSMLLAATLEGGLEERYGPKWWEERRAGAALVELWSGGNRSSPDELARAMGGDGLSIGPLVRKLEARLAPLLVPPKGKEAPPVRPEAPKEREEEEGPPPAVASRATARGAPGPSGSASRAR